MDADDLLLANSEAPLLNDTYTAAADTAAAVIDSQEEGAPAAEGGEDESGYLSMTPVKPDTQLKFLKLVLQLRALKFKKAVEVPAEAEGDANGASSSATTTAEVWDVTTGPQLADVLRRKVFKEVTGTGAAGNSSDVDLVDACINDVLRAFSKKLARLDGSVVSPLEGTKGDKKKSRKEKKNKGGDDEESSKKKDKKSKKDKKKKKEKKQKRSKFVDDMAGESDDESDY